MKQKLLNVFKSPAFSVMLLLIAAAIIIMSGVFSSKKVGKSGNTVPAMIPDTTAETTGTNTSTAESKTTTTTTTATTSTTTVTTTQTTTTAPPETQTEAPAVEEAPAEETAAVDTEAAPEAAPAEETAQDTGTAPAALPSNYVGDSPNSAFYQERICIAGDSIAYGFDVYGFVPDEHNIARESVSMWNLDYFTFNFGAGDMGLVDAVAYVHPQLLYMSLGMNDLHMNSADSYAQRYSETVQQILQKIPDTNIVVAGITPVSADSTYTTNDRIREYNSALKSSIEAINSTRVYYFDAYTVVADESGNLRSDCSAGDGIHLATHCYSDFLTALFNYLDTTPVKKQIESA